MNKNSIVSPLKNHIDKFLFGLSLLTLVSVLVLRFFFLDRGLIFSDEGWYLCLLRDLPTDDGSTKFHLLFKNIFNNNIYAIRVACYLLMLVSSIVFAAGLYNYLNKKLSKKTNFIYCLGVIYMGQMSVIACPSFNYITLNISIAELSIGLLLLFLSNQKIIYSLLSGFFIGFLFPVMITNVIVIPIMIIVLFCLSEKRWKSVLLFLGGILLFFIFYCVVIEKPNEYISSIIGQTQTTINNGSSSYGLLFLFKWLGLVAYYLIKQLTVAFSLIFCLKGRRDQKFNIMYVLFAFLILCAVYAQPLPLYGKRFIETYWILIFIFLFNNRITLNNKNLLITLLFMLLPICLSFGTNVDFRIRQSSYFMFLTPVLFLIPNLNYKWKTVLAIFFMAMWLVFIHKVFFKTNWFGDSLLTQNHKLTEIGIKQNIKLDSRYLEMVRFCNEKIGKDDDLYVMNNQCWGVAALLDRNVISYAFHPIIDVSYTEKIIIPYLSKGKTVSIITKEDQKEIITSLIENNNYEFEEYQNGNMKVVRFRKKE